LAAVELFDFYAVTTVQVYFRITEVSNNPLPYALLLAPGSVLRGVMRRGKLGGRLRHQTVDENPGPHEARCEVHGLAAMGRGDSVRLVNPAGLVCPTSVRPDDLFANRAMEDSVLLGVYTAHYDHARFA